MKVYTFTEPTLPAIGAVGGKGLSLMRMTGAGFAVPPGVVLPVEFFAPWVDALSTHDAWRALGDAHGDEALSRACADITGACAGLAFTDAQRRALDEALGHFASTTFFAVRSSSPEEDLDGSSFAGGYETVLGVPRDAMEPAVRRAFASCLDVRVAVYKRAHGFDVTRPRIAVVVQKQVASDVAGVGFSVDPITNDHDRAVFNANWGLGETVVAGLASPDLFTVDKVARAVIGRAPGRKETSIWLTPSGGTVEREDPRHDTLTLTDDQVLALADQLARIEAHYGRPMDIEWAFEAGALYILQARPITTHRSLPEGMMTAPGERRRLYWDVSVSVQGVFDPLSPMASSCWQAMISAASEAVFGRDITREVERSPVIIRGGRLWAHVSALLTVVPLRSMIEMIPAIDPVAAATLATIEDEAPWRTEHSLKGVPWGLLWHAPEKAAQLLEARLAPEHARAHVDALCARLRAEVEALADERLPFDRFANEAVARTARGMFLDVLPCFVSAKIAMGKIRGIFEDATEEESRWLAKLDQSLPGNVTVEMGLALVDLAAHLPPDMTLDALERGVAEGSAPRDFLAGWRDFLARYGHRGPGEIDVASPRYRDRPRMLLSQLAGVAGASGTDASPRAIYERSQRERREVLRAGVL
jgi:pyruvate,water dikinase